MLAGRQVAPPLPLAPAPPTFAPLAPLASEPAAPPLGPASPRLPRVSESGFCSSEHPPEDSPSTAAHRILVFSFFIEKGERS